MKLENIDPLPGIKSLFHKILEIHNSYTQKSLTWYPPDI